MSSILLLVEDLSLERDDKSSSSWSLESLLRLLLKSSDASLLDLDLDLDTPSSLCPSYTPLSLELADEEPVEAEAETDLLDSRSAVGICSAEIAYLKFDCALAACTVSLPLVPVRSFKFSLVAA